ncbi:MAG: hydroxyacylglutathione hydrolase [Hyphomicrobiaceae bacterium]|nr:hydroxyacylglutathione hydrolase [Hyphomicrobiaceae bacterium]
MPTPSIVLVPCLSDNYCALLHSAASGETLAIDAPQAEPIKAALSARGWRLSDILITHHHNDHTGGCQALKDFYGCRVTGPDSEAERLPGTTRSVNQSSQLTFDGHEVRVLETPGHTLGHVSYYFPHLGAVFTGDTLFALGCGRIFEGDAATMFASLQTLAALPDDTKVYCGHEYTLSNARFALSVEPENRALADRVKDIEAQRAAGQPTLPTTIGLEKATNPFLRTESAAIRARLGLPFAPPVQVFARLRELKNKA